MGDYVEPPDLIERQTLCFSSPQPGMVVQPGQTGFKEELLRLYSPAESNATEQLVKLKDTLRKTKSEAFWPLLTEGLANITDAQYAFVSKRILVDDDDVAVEMPPIGEPGACLMGAAFYMNDGHGTKQQLRNFKYHAYSCPCAYMRHDKIFIIPEKLNDFIHDNPNKLQVPGEAYLGIPLWADGKCFAHFGVMWSPEGASRRILGWGFLELLLHGLEDLILERVLEAKDLAKSAKIAEPVESASPVQEETSRVIPYEAVIHGQSLKPYARSLSHELRTPMQGVVGMLDVMMANVKEAGEGLNDPRMRQVFKTMKENIETVQDSSRRAVEAADNVVHAYDMNMGVPETPLSPLDKIAQDEIFLQSRRPDILVTGNNIPLTQFRGIKRKRDDFTRRAADIPDNQARVARVARRKIRDSCSEEPPARRSRSATAQKVGMNGHTPKKDIYNGISEATYESPYASSPIFASEHSLAPGLRHTDLREVIRYIINDALKVGGRPDSAVAKETEFGESIEVLTRSSSGQPETKQIEWMVTPDVPDTILIDEKDLAKTVSCVILNAIKFTPNGKITLRASLSAKARYIVIHVQDTGMGIPANFLPKLFKAFSREDNSTTRESEGLGLGLLVAKGLARKLGGDLHCVRSEVQGPHKGSDFEMRIPLTPGEICSRPSSPFGSRSPSLNSRHSIDKEVSPFVGPQPPATPPQPSEKKVNGLPIPACPCPIPLAAFKDTHALHHVELPTPRSGSDLARPRPRLRTRTISDNYDRDLGTKFPLNVLVVEDNKINRKLLVSMLAKLGYSKVSEAYDGNNAVEQMRKPRSAEDQIDFILMDLWMPLKDGFQATESIFKMNLPNPPTIVAVSADITDDAMCKADEVGMKGYLTKPFQIRDLQRIIVECCATTRTAVDVGPPSS